MEAQSGEYTSGSNETRLIRINKRGLLALHCRQELSKCQYGIMHVAQVR